MFFHLCVTLKDERNNLFYRARQCGHRFLCKCCCDRPKEKYEFLKTSTTSTTKQIKGEKVKAWWAGEGLKFIFHHYDCSLSLTLNSQETLVKILTSFPNERSSVVAAIFLSDYLHLSLWSYYLYLLHRLLSILPKVSHSRHLSFNLPSSPSPSVSLFYVSVCLYLFLLLFNPSASFNTSIYRSIFFPIFLPFYERGFSIDFSVTHIHTHTHRSKNQITRTNTFYGTHR